MSDRLITLIVIDGDPIFRLGLTMALGAFNDLQIIGQADTAATVWDLLTAQVPDIVILEPNFGQIIPDGWQICQQIQQQYPQIKICLLSSTEDLPRLNRAKNSGVAGYCNKGMPVTEIVAVLRQLAEGQQHWQVIADQPQPLPAKQWLIRLRQLGLTEIDENLHQVEQQLNYAQSSLINRLFWQGRQRELRAARWLVRQLLPVEVVMITPQTSLPLSPLSVTTQQLQNITYPLSTNAVIAFNNTLTKIGGTFNNLSGIVLEVTVLQPDKKRELFYVILQQIKRSLEKLQVLNLDKVELQKQLSLVLVEIWYNSVVDFFGKYYQSLNLKEDLEDIIGEEREIVKQEILAKIPLVDQLFAYFLINTGLIIDGIEYRPESPEARERADFILQNLILKISNAVLTIILNNFSDVEQIKKLLYNRSLLSNREIARFRNELSWRYRREKYWEEPRDIFESRYRLLIFQNSSIKILWIYAPRQQELEQLQGIQWLVTFAWEIRDAIAPRLQAITRAIGNALVYLLAKIIGRGIGLIGRGIIQGIGSNFQDIRYTKNSKEGL